jgi:translation initiation factor IF-3
MSIAISTMSADATRSRRYIKDAMRRDGLVYDYKLLAGFKNLKLRKRVAIRIYRYMITKGDLECALRVAVDHLDRTDVVFACVELIGSKLRADETSTAFQLWKEHRITTQEIINSWVKDRGAFMNNRKVLGFVDNAERTSRDIRDTIRRGKFVYNNKCLAHLTDKEDRKEVAKIIYKYMITKGDLECALRVAVDHLDRADVVFACVELMGSKLRADKSSAAFQLWKEYRITSQEVAEMEIRNKDAFMINDCREVIRFIEDIGRGMLRIKEEQQKA